MICEKTGKEMHTKDKASQHLWTLKKRFGYKGDKFFCKYCQSWHVGKCKKVVNGNS